MKWIIVTVICLLGTAVHAETDGSVASIGWTQNEIAVAADSRQSRGSSYSDTSCKIAALGNKLIFAATGRSSSRFDPSWDAYAVAPKDYKRIAGKGTPDHLATKMADAWGEDVKVEFQKLGSGAVSDLDDNVIMAGLFADFEKDGTLLIAVANITYRTLPTKQVVIENVTNTVPSTHSKPNAYFIGHLEVINAVNSPQTSEQEEWVKQYKTTAIEWSDKFGRDDNLGAVTGYVDVTIRHLAKTKVDSQGVPFSVVGPPIAARERD